MTSQIADSLNSSHTATTSDNETAYTALTIRNLPSSPHISAEEALCRLTVVNHLNDDTIIDHMRVYVSTNDTIQDVKYKISQLRGLEVDAVKLFDFWDKELDEKVTLKEAKLHDLSVIHCYISVSSREASIMDEIPPESSPLHQHSREEEEDEDEPAEEYVESRSNKRERLVIGILLLAIGLCAVTVILLETVPTNDSIPRVRQAIVIDAGSSASKPHVYKWQGIPGKTVLNIMETPNKCKKAPGMANERPPDVGKGTLECLNNQSLLLSIEHAPREEVHLFLGATAGLRMLNHENSSLSNALIREMRVKLASTRYNVQPQEDKIRIISGSEEAFYAWITVNYVMNVFQPETSSSHPTETYGSLDLGGASAQVAFTMDLTEVPDAIQSSSSSDMKNLTLFGKSYHVYAKSFLCFGKDQAHARFLATILKNNNFSTVVNNPCRIKGSRDIFTVKQIFGEACVNGSLAMNIFGKKISLPSTTPVDTNFTFIGTSEPDQCETLVNSLLSKSACEGSACSSFFLYKPRIRRHKYMAFSGYYYVSNGLNLVPNQSIENYRQGVIDFCVDQRQDTSSKYAKRYCMEGFYIIALLSHYGFTPQDWNKIYFVDKEGNFSMGWTLGFILYQILHLKDQISSRLVPRGLLIIFLVICGAFLICGLLICYFITRKRPLFTNRRGAGSPCWLKLLPPV